MQKENIHQTREEINAEILTDLQYDDLSDDMKMLHDVIGMEAVCKLILYLPSTEFYIPKITSIRPLMTRQVKKLYRGDNIREVCSRVGLSKSFVYRQYHPDKND